MLDKNHSLKLLFPLSGGRITASILRKASLGAKFLIDKALNFSIFLVDLSSSFYQLRLRPMTN